MIREILSCFLLMAACVKAPLPTYSWDREDTLYPPLTKEYFRCHCSEDPIHSLPIREEKEFIYPILINLLNHVQTKSAHRVVITSGHRCPNYNTLCDPSIENRPSKHQIGAEVSFYVEGMEHRPEEIIDFLLSYFPDEEFQRWPLEKTNVSTPPWYNKEVFIKLFKNKEGRNSDNRHPHPYISIQVRHDRDLNERVSYTWEKAHKGYYRW